MNMCGSNWFVLLIAVMLSGCVSMHAPLEADDNYPQEWARLQTLGPKCEALGGHYLNQGLIAVAVKDIRPVSLTTLLNIKSDAKTVSLKPRTIRLDKAGDAFTTLEVTPDAEPVNRREIEGCGCIKETLLCPIQHGGWAVPLVAVGGSQSTIIFSKSSDGSLVAMLQNYSVGLILVAPIFTIDEPWVQFTNVEVDR